MPDKYLIAGGDMRFPALAEYLSREDDTVYITGFDPLKIQSEKVIFTEDICNLPEKVDYIILPMPAANEGTVLFAPYSDRKTDIRSMTGILNKDGVVFGGKISSYVHDIFTSCGFPVYDYLNREELAVMNALATAEGAVQIALREQPVILSGQKILILGMGRIAKALIRILSGFGTDITVAARKYADLAWAGVYGCSTVHINELGSSDICEKTDLIFNTVPSPVLGADILKNCRKDCLLIDLASKPGGIDIAAAGALGLHAIWALSLPGKTAPETSGKIIAETIGNILRERREIF